MLNVEVFHIFDTAFSTEIILPVFTKFALAKPAYKTIVPWLKFNPGTNPIKLFTAVIYGFS
jgi:hypothetical protein